VTMPPPSWGWFVTNPGSSTVQSSYGLTVAQGMTVPKELKGVHFTRLWLSRPSQGPGVPHSCLSAHEHTFCPRTPKHAMADTPPDLTERWDQDTYPGLKAQNRSRHRGTSSISTDPIIFKIG